MDSKSKLFQILARVSILFFLIAIIYTSFFSEQSKFVLIFFPISISFLIYFVWLRKRFELFRFRTGILLALCIRFLLIFSFPNLSDDIYRFMWDGFLTGNGYNPYSHLPTEIMSMNLEIPGINERLLKLLNSPEYFTIYPPACQFIFAIPSIFGIQDWYTSSILYKSIMFLVETGTILLILKILKLLKKPSYFVFIYALNPLILVEIMGNLHFEGLMIFFFSLFYYLLLQSKDLGSINAFAFSIVSKMHSLITFPFLLKIYGFRKMLYSSTALFFIIIILSFPIWYHLNLDNFSSSLELYFQNFEFNASIYYISRFFGFQIVGYNLIGIIGPFFGLLTLLIILRILYKDWEIIRLSNLPVYWMISFSIYLWLATTVHPWYLSMLILFCTFTPYNYPIIWSWLAYLSYSIYDNPTYAENYFLIALEYSVVFFIAWKEKRPAKKYLAGLFKFILPLGINTPKDRVQN